jgi:hypothetical protein
VSAARQPAAVVGAKLDLAGVLAWAGWERREVEVRNA